MLRNSLLPQPTSGAEGQCIPCSDSVTFTASCTIPVDGGGRLGLHHYVYRDPTGKGEMEIAVLTSLSLLTSPDRASDTQGAGEPDVRSEGVTSKGAHSARSRMPPPLVRVHDQCITSEVFGSLKCDCREQLLLALRRLASEPGAVIYMPQEGRGIGLGNKIRAYHLQESQGLDTVDANLALGLPEEARQ
eukprot:m.175538 g.175538  ORF g.175538 m.175538 type:complete len:189 (-) comp24412_c0_seq2:926-1492(-)